MAPIGNIWIAGGERGLDYTVAAASKYFRNNGTN
jgi:hypothetical protein